MRSYLVPGKTSQNGACSPDRSTFASVERDCVRHRRASGSAACNRRMHSSCSGSRADSLGVRNRVSSSTLHAGAVESRGATVAFSSTSSKRSVVTCPLRAASQTAMRPSYMHANRTKRRIQLYQNMQACKGLEGNEDVSETGWGDGSRRDHMCSDACPL